MSKGSRIYVVFGSGEEVLFMGKATDLAKLLKIDRQTAYGRLLKHEKGEWTGERVMTTGLISSSNNESIGNAEYRMLQNSKTRPENLKAIPEPGSWERKNR
jgi:hypothetical protein